MSYLLNYTFFTGFESKFNTINLLLQSEVIIQLTCYPVAIALNIGREVRY